jgi:hypothetical protein
LNTTQLRTPHLTRFIGIAHGRQLHRCVGLTMKTSKFTDAQKVFIIRQGEDGTPVDEVCRKTLDHQRQT